MLLTKKYWLRVYQFLETTYSLECNALGLVEGPTLHENTQNLLTILFVEVSRQLIESILLCLEDKHLSHSSFQKFEGPLLAMVKIEPVTASCAHIVRVATRWLLLMVDGEFEEDHSGPFSNNISEQFYGIRVDGLAHELDAEVENVLIFSLHRVVFF